MKEENKLSLTGPQKVELPFKHEEKRKHFQSMSRTPVERLNIFFQRLLLITLATIFSRRTFPSLAFISNHAAKQSETMSLVMQSKQLQATRLTHFCRLHNMQMTFHY